MEEAAIAVCVPQPCRMAYELYEDGQKVATDGKYLLSPKDLSLIDRVKELDVDSLKIEGRMKSSEYVYETVRQVENGSRQKANGTG